MNVCCKMQINHIIWVCFDGNRQWKLLFLPAYVLLSFFDVAVYFFSLSSFLFMNHSDSSYINVYLFEETLQCHPDATLSLTETMNKDSSYCKMSPSLSNHQNTRVRKGHVFIWQLFIRKNFKKKPFKRLKGRLICQCREYYSCPLNGCTCQQKASQNLKLTELTHAENLHKSWYNKFTLQTKFTQYSETAIICKQVRFN